MADLPDVISALTADADEMDELLAGLDPASWALPTPAPEWTVAHQVAHLAATFRMAGMAAADPTAFAALNARLGPNFTANVQAALEEFLGDPPAALLARWRSERAAAVGALAATAPDALVPWLVTPLPPAVLAAAGMMELFAHGQDVADAVGGSPVRTDRIRYLVEFVVRTWTFGYLARDLTPPGAPFRFELTAPSGATWRLGPPDAAQAVSGPALDLCLLATRRRHRDDLDLAATGPDADRWLDIAQAYRGPAGQGRRPGQSADRAAVPSGKDIR